MQQTRPPEFSPRVWVQTVGLIEERKGVLIQFAHMSDEDSAWQHGSGSPDLQIYRSETTNSPVAIFVPLKRLRELLDRAEAIELASPVQRVEIDF